MDFDLNLYSIFIDKILNLNKYKNITKILYISDRFASAGRDIEPAFNFYKDYKNCLYFSKQRPCSLRLHYPWGSSKGTLSPAAVFFDYISACNKR